MSLTACGYAARQFETMVETFRQQNDPIVYLEELKGPLFSLFKNKYLQTADEKVAASTLCDLLATSIEKQVMDSLGSLVFKDMAIVPWFANKSALKAKILKDLGDNLHHKRHDALKDIFLYLKNAKLSLQKWIKVYTKEHCQACEKGQPRSRLVVLATGKLLEVVRVVGKKVCEVTSEWKDKGYDHKGIEHGDYEGLDTKEWLDTLCSKLTSTLEVSIFKTGFQDLGGVQKLKDLENFTQEVQEGLQTIQSDLQEKFKGISVDVLDASQNKPYDLLFDQLCGCCEQCPFCKEPCDCTNKEHDVKHSVLQHRSLCLGGYRNTVTQEMMAEVCSSKIGCDKSFQSPETGWEFKPYKQYSKFYPRWSIPVDMSAQCSTYWKWFVGNYSEEIADHFNAKANEIPRAWKELEWEAARGELEALYNV